MRSTNGDVNPTVGSSLVSAPATWFLIGTNVGVFLLLPIVFKSRFPYHRESLGALWGPLVFSGEWWRVLTCSFVHFELFHLIPNMLALWLLGPRIERQLGKWVFLSFYLLCGAVVALTVLVLHPFAVLVGASGPIAGLVGAIIATYVPRLRSLSWGERVKLGILILYAAGLVTTEVTRGGLYLAHTPGLTTGIVLDGILVYVAKTKRGIYWTLAAATLIIVIAVATIQWHHRFIS